eukprot:s159_g42.t1
MAMRLQRSSLLSFAVLLLCAVVLPRLAFIPSRASRVKVTEPAALFSSGLLFGPSAANAQVKAPRPEGLPDFLTTPDKDGRRWGRFSLAISIFAVPVVVMGVFGAALKAWTAYGFSTLWVVPSVAEDAGDVGGKVFFLITQGLAIASMGASRRLAELAEARSSESNYRMAEFGCTGAEMVGATVGTTVGSPVMVGAMNDLQSTVERLDQQVQELSRRQAMMEKELASRKEAPRDLMQTDPIGQDNTQELL